MAMNAITRKNICEIFQQIEMNKEYTEFQLYSIVERYLTRHTFEKYVKVEQVFCSTPTEISLQELLNFVNSCAGEDCYEAHWDYQLVDGKIYNVYAERRFIVKGWKVEI